MYLALIFHEEEPWHVLISFRLEFKRAFKHISIFNSMNHHNRTVRVLSVRCIPNNHAEFEPQ